MAAEKSSKVHKLLASELLILGLLTAGPVSACGVFVSAGGPYDGVTGQEIEFDASGSYMLDGSPIEAYYWDWHGDGLFECFTTPTAVHTWHSAFSGLVRVYVFYDHGVDPNGHNTAKVDWADAAVVITGPETALTLTVSSNVELRLSDERGRSIGTDPVTGVFEMEIPGATIELVPPETGNAVEVAEASEEEDWPTRYTIPLVTGSAYDLTLTGLETGPFDLCVQGLQDGACIQNQAFKEIINAGEKMRMKVSACCLDNGLCVSCSGLLCCPGLAVAPDKIDLAVQPGGRYEAAITVSETLGFRSLCEITLTCSDLTGEVYTIKASDISFDRSVFDVAPGGTETAIMTVDIPASFVGKVAGTVTVACAGGQSEMIDVVLHKVSAHAPIVTVGGPYSGVVGSPVTFDATGSYDPDGTIVSYCWDWDLKGEYECVDGPVCTHTWDEAYSGTVRLSAVDNEGNATEQYAQVVIAME